MLVTAGAGGIETTWAPFVVDRTGGDGIDLVAHVARANPHWRCADGAEGLASFLVADSYVSPNWYPSKAEHGRAVPTWNYIAVEARGAVELFHDEARLRDLLERLTRRHEAGEIAPWSMDQAPADYLDRLLGGIVGVRLHVVELTGVWKLGQNHSEADQAGVRAALSALGAPAELLDGVQSDLAATSA
ncbi:MAG: FMN-binding negative transcriptional regulator [Caulobacteraceae bacterium]|nr:FMN-binding negative transcriptional regulator [Caulobacteraceae bacterium]